MAVQLVMLHKLPVFL